MRKATAANDTAAESVGMIGTCFSARPFQRRLALGLEGLIVCDNTTRHCALEDDCQEVFGWHSGECQRVVALESEAFIKCRVTQNNTTGGAAARQSQQGVHHQGTSDPAALVAWAH